MKYAVAVLAFVAFVNADTGGGGHGHAAPHHAPVHHAPAPHHAPVHHTPVHEPVHHEVHHGFTPVYHAASHQPAPVHYGGGHKNVHHEPSYHAPEPVYHAPVHHAPSYHAPAAHHGPSYHAPSYAPSYGYGGASGGRGALQRGQGFQAQLGRGLRRLEGGTAALVGGWLRGQGYYINSYGLRDAGDQFIEYGKRVAGPGPYGPDPIPQIIGV